MPIGKVFPCHSFVSDSITVHHVYNVIVLPFFMKLGQIDPLKIVTITFSVEGMVFTYLSWCNHICYTVTDERVLWISLKYLYLGTPSHDLVIADSVSMVDCCCRKFRNKNDAIIDTHPSDFLQLRQHHNNS